MDIIEYRYEHLVMLLRLRVKRNAEQQQISKTIDLLCQALPADRVEQAFRAISAAA